MTSVPARRRGPRTDVDTRTLIVDVAEKMFGNATIDAVSLRSVAREAGLGTRAVTYHFASKRDLVAAIIHRRSSAFASQTASGLAALTEREQTPSVRDVVEAILNPFLTQLRDDPRRASHWIKVFTQLALAEDQLWLDELRADQNITALFLAAAARAMPEINDPNVQRRAGIAMYSMITMLANIDRTAYGHPLTDDGVDRDWIEQLVISTSAGLLGRTGD